MLGNMVYNILSRVEYAQLILGSAVPLDRDMCCLDSEKNIFKKNIFHPNIMQ